MKRRCFLCAALSAIATTAFGRPGNWAHRVQVPQGWWESLRSKKGYSCCANADGQRVDDPNWQQTGENTYRVMLDGQWYDVGPDQVVEATNKVGFAVVWPNKWQDENGQQVWTIRCFMPGIQA